jgi:hypothetical protein
MPAAEAMENDVLTHQFRSGSWTKPTALWVAVLTATPEDTGGMVEVSAAEYARQQRDPSDANWPQAADNSVYNADAISYAEPVTDWGEVIAVALFDAETGGNLRAYQLLDTPKNVTAGGPLLQFQPGALKWRMNDLTP